MGANRLSSYLCSNSVERESQEAHKKGREQSGNKARYKIMTRSSVCSMAEFSHREIRLNCLTRCVQRRGNGRSAKALGMQPQSLSVDGEKERKKKNSSAAPSAGEICMFTIEFKHRLFQNLQHDTVQYHNLEIEPVYESVICFCLLPSLASSRIRFDNNKQFDKEKSSSSFEVWKFFFCS